MTRRAVVALVFLLVAGGACSDRDATTTPTTRATTSSSTTTTDVALATLNCNAPEGNSPAIFSASGGTYAAQSLTVVGDDRVRFDVVQWLSGDEADEAYFRETGDDSGVPNDYFIVNRSKELRTAPVADDAKIRVLKTDTGEFRLEAVALRDVAPDADDTFWLSFDSGHITEICHQYQP